MVCQHIVENGQKRTLEEFVLLALSHLEQHLGDDEVVQQADNIIELEHDAMTAPQRIYELPDGYEYNFSGFYGQVIGVGRTGIKELPKRGG